LILDALRGAEAPLFHVAAHHIARTGSPDAFFHSSVSFCGSFSETLLLSSGAAVLHSPPTVARAVSVANGRREILSRLS